MLDHVIIWDVGLTQALNDITASYMKAYKNTRVTGFMRTSSNVFANLRAFNKAEDSNKISSCGSILLQ